MMFTSDDPLSDLLSHLVLEPVGPNAAGNDVFRGRSQRAGNGRIFGGLVFAQAMRAGQSTVEDRAVHSAHSYFLRPGDPETPIDYIVERIRDGRSFTTRRIIALQDDTPIFNLSMSFQVHEEGPARQIDALIPTEPAGEEYEDGLIRAMATRGFEIRKDMLGSGPIQILVEDGLDMIGGTDRRPELRAWFRARGPLPDEPALHAAILAYTSDQTIVIAAQHPMEWGIMDEGTQSASLDHAIWFHDDFRIDDWLYAVHDSPVLKHSRALGRALFYSRDGRLVASAVQEGLMRRHA
ncbi:MAG: acyl-CoA thioesterase II [bacterium]|nr:acyl-CoA thioesterase II [Deltaproteobacteria bacterium]MCP4908216.1 acyl-CoA thioesterase II [bacterium]